MEKVTPRDVGVDHATWRPNQYEMYETALIHHHRRGKYIFGELGTGSGKSAVATALGHHQPTTVLVHTLALLDQYHEKYGFAIIKGRQEYPCVLPEKVALWRIQFKMPTAMDCHFAQMQKCPSSQECPYIIQKNLALTSQRMACTYRYASVSYKVHTRAGFLIMDEAHDSVTEMLAFNETVFSKKRLDEYGLPPFPIVKCGENGRGAILGGNQLEVVKAWMTACIHNINEYSEEELSTPFGARISRYQSRLARVLISLEEDPWFMSTDGEEPILRPLTANNVADKIFSNKNLVLMMSATIGDPKPIADELGISGYSFRSFPHPVPAEFRKIHDLNLPRMTHRNIKDDPNLLAFQAVEIANWIKQFDPSYRTVIMTTAYYKINAMKRLLNKELSKRRITYQGDGRKLSEVVTDFITKPQPGDVLVGTIQGLGSGLDLKDDLARLAVIAGVPHVNPTDPYAKARRQLHGGERFQQWSTYNAVMQACGRVSRGEKNPDGSFQENHAALADGSTTSPKAMRYYSDWFKKAIVK